VAPRIALGNKDGKNRINISANCSSSSVLDMLDAHVDGAPESVYVNSEEVRIAKLDTIKSDYIGKENNIFLKIDVQGFEYQVLEGAKKTLLSVQGMEVELIPRKATNCDFSMALSNNSCVVQARNSELLRAFTPCS